MATAPRRERKIVSVLFADLVGFAARAESLDPEDVDAILRPYHERLRAELERHGGTVEKFIGDAVMALFGAPVAHEDDPERAVRAALAIRDWARDEGDVQVRIAVNTGEALINLGARPEGGEGMAAGDVVNTAARLQSAAPVNAVVVGEATYRATAEAIDFREGDPVVAKGKSMPVRVWEALESRARVGTEAVTVRAALVGRQRELDQLVNVFERTRQEQSVQLVTVAGVPGIGKSRLVAELLAHVESFPDLVYWRHGRSLPYGEGVTFWALGEMVKAQAGVLESDSPGEVERKLDEAVREVVDESERRWVVGRLRPLLGLGGEAEVGGERDESFAAWRRFFESLALRRPLVMVFEDLHWAGDELLDFVDELPEWVEDVPLLVLCTARPELLDRRPGWGGGKRNALTISLSPLDPEDTAKLVAALLERSVLPADTQAELLARAGGNPLYAEQFVRMLVERGDVASDVPQSIQGIIAARLDSLAEDEKRLVQDAAVIGKVFWTSSLGAVNGSDPATVEQRLRSLVRKEFIRRERRASVEGEAEYTFNHVLVRDVAYGQIPRLERADKHRRTAEWIESLGRAEDQAELLAHHYVSALELLEESGVSTGDLPAHARKALRVAGTRALALYAPAAAARSFEGAERLGGEADPDRPQALLQYGLALLALLDPRRFDLLEEARSALAAAGDTEGAAEADLALAEAWWWAGERDRCAACLERAAALVRGGEASLTSALVLSQAARFYWLFGDDEAAIRVGREALGVSETVHRDDLCAKNLITLGTARLEEPDVEPSDALADIRQGMELAAASGELSQLNRGYVNLAACLERLGELGEAESTGLEALRLAQRRGSFASIRFNEGNLITSELIRGRWEAAERRANAFLDESGEDGHYFDNVAHQALAVIGLARDQEDMARFGVERSLEIARRIKDPQVVVPALAAAATVHAELGDVDRARTLLRELEPVPFIGTEPGAFFAASRLGEAEEWGARTAAFLRDTPWDRAARAVLDGRWADAAAVYEEMGARPDAAMAALRAAEAFVAEGRRAEANDQLASALSFWREVGAKRYVRQAESLLAASA